MKQTKMMIRVFTIADYEAEEAFLQKQHRQGWKLTNFKAPCFYRFEACAPEDVVYRMDYRGNSGKGDQDAYFQMFSDFGWEYSHSCNNFHCFRKAVVQQEDQPEIFSDDASKLEMLSRIIKGRMIPILIIFLCAVIPQTYRAINSEYGSKWFTGFLLALFVAYVALIVHCIRRFYQLKRKYGSLKRES